MYKENYDSYVFVSSYGVLDAYENILEAKDYFLTYIFSSEGLERERYTHIFLNMETEPDKKYYTDGSPVYQSKIDIDLIPKNIFDYIKTSSHLNEQDLLYIKAQYDLSQVSNEISPLLWESCGNDIEKYINSRRGISNKRNSYFTIKNWQIICFDIRDINFESDNSYSMVQIPLKEYEYACEWLCGRRVF